MIPALAHALPQSIGAVPLTLVLTALLGIYLAIGAISTRRAASQVGTARVGTTSEARVPPAPDQVTYDEQVDHDGQVTHDEQVDHDAQVDRVDGAVDGGDRVRPTPGQLLGVVGLVVVAALATAGPSDAGSNLTDQAVLSVLWGAVAISSIVAGPWWHRVDPLRGVSGMLAAAVGDPEQDLARPLPPRVATTAALAGLLVWAWLQMLVVVTVTAFQAALLVYVAMHLAGATRYGVTWLRQAESLNVVSGTLGLLRPDGQGPLRRLTGMADDDRLRVICGALIAWSLVDLVIESEAWHDLALPRSTGAVLLVLAVGAMYGLIRAVSSRARLGPAFVAVAGGWVVAHYLSILLIEGQGIPIWLSDPFSTGADLLGRRGDVIDFEPLPLGLMAVLQAVPFVAGHLLAVVVVQRRAARVATRAGQLGPATFFARTLIGGLLLTGLYLQLGGGL